MAFETEGRDIPKYRANSFQNTFPATCASSQTETIFNELPVPSHSPEALSCVADSPRGVQPCMRFLFVGSQLCTPASFRHHLAMMPSWDAIAKRRRLPSASTFATIEIMRDHNSGVHVQRTLTSQVHAHAGRTQFIPLDRKTSVVFAIFEYEKINWKIFGTHCINFAASEFWHYTQSDHIVQIMKWIGSWYCAEY